MKVIEGNVSQEWAGEGPLGGDITYYDVDGLQDTLVDLEGKRVRITIEVLA